MDKKENTEAEHTYSISNRVSDKALMQDRIYNWVYDNNYFNTM